MTNKIKERLAAATAGPWHVWSDGRFVQVVREQCGKRPLNVVDCPKNHEAQMATADFIANAPTDIAYLLAENDRLGAVVEAANLWAKAKERRIINAFHPSPAVHMRLDALVVEAESKILKALDNLKAAK